MDQTTDIQASEELTLPGNHAAASADGLVVDNANDNAGQEEGFEIVLKDDEKPKQDRQLMLNLLVAASNANASVSLSNRWKRLSGESCRSTCG